MVSTWATANHISLGQVVVDRESDEITAIPKLLGLLEISGSWVTIEAMGCQSEIAGKTFEGKADYVLAVKGQRPEHIEVRRNDEAYFDALGAERIPDPTTAGDFRRRSSEGDVEQLMDTFSEARLQAWEQQPDACFDEAVIDADGTMAPTDGWCKQGVNISYKGV